MTLTAVVRRVGINRKRVILAVVALALATGILTYLAKYEYCSFRSKFCVVAIAGTRSEVGFTWESWKTAQLYVSTYPVGG